MNPQILRINNQAAIAFSEIASISQSLPPSSVGMGSFGAQIDWIEVRSKRGAVWIVPSDQLKDLNMGLTVSSIIDKWMGRYHD